MFRLTVEASGSLSSSALIALAEREYGQALRQAGERAEQRIKELFASEDVNATEETSKAIKTSDVQRDSFNRSSVEVRALGDRARILEYIELGRPEGKRPPLEAIEKWIEDKGVLPREANIFTRRDLAFVIARSIGANGTKGKHIFKRVSEELENDPELFRLFQAATDRIVAAANLTR